MEAQKAVMLKNIKLNVFLSDTVIQEWPAMEHFRCCRAALPSSSPALCMTRTCSSREHTEGVHSPTEGEERNSSYQEIKTKRGLH